jgi:AcrR family transcriptional regulator
MLAEGATTLSLEAVARRAGVSRPSIYKRWSTLAELLLDATLLARQRALPPEAMQQGFPAPDTGSLSSDLRALVEVGVALFRTLEGGGVMRALLAEAIRSEEFALRFETTILAPDEGQLRTIFQRAAERGEWPTLPNDASDNDAVLVLRSLIAHAIFERYVLHRPFEGTLTFRLAELLARGSRPDSTT